MLGEAFDERQVEAGKKAAGSCAHVVAVAKILARGEPVYGLNTGFGKLAGVRIASSFKSPLEIGPAQVPVLG